MVWMLRLDLRRRERRAEQTRAVALCAPPGELVSRAIGKCAPLVQRSLRFSWLLALALARPSAAQEEPSGTSYITPFPEGDVYKLQAYGDGFAEGLLNGLVEAFRRRCAACRCRASIARCSA